MKVFYEIPITWTDALISNHKLAKRDIFPANKKSDAGRSLWGKVDEVRMENFSYN